MRSIVAEPARAPAEQTIAALEKAQHDSARILILYSISAKAEVQWLLDHYMCAGCDILHNLIKGNCTYTASRLTGSLLGYVDDRGG